MTDIVTPRPTPRMVRLTTDGEKWRVEILRRSWLLGAYRWCPVEFGITKKHPFTFNEIIARQRFDEVTKDERRRADGRHRWRLVQESPRERGADPL